MLQEINLTALYVGQKYLFFFFFFACASFPCPNIPDNPEVGGMAGQHSDISDELDTFLTLYGASDYFW